MTKKLNEFEQKRKKQKRSSAPEHDCNRIYIAEQMMIFEMSGKKSFDLPLIFFRAMVSSMYSRTHSIR